MAHNRWDNDSTRPIVMVVDDEEIVTRSIANLLELDTDYIPVTFQSPAAALALARRERIDCVVTDFLMPDMDGLEFLKNMKVVAPDVPGILLTGYADKENAIKAINEVNLYQYLEKPWDNERLKMVIRNAVEHRSLERALSDRLRDLDRALRDRDSLRTTAAELEQELSLAQEVQQSILPRHLKSDGDFHFYHRYYPTGRLGGDYFDIVPTGPGRFNAIVADVAGHGVPASLGTMLVKVIFYEASHRGECCDGMFALMNLRLLEFLPMQQYVTAFALNFNAEEATVTASSAGGPHPILFSRDPQRPVEEWRLNGLPLGAFGEQIYREPEAQTRPLAHGDRLLLYTDGLLDVDVDTGESADPQRLVDLVDELRHCDGEELLDRIVAAFGADRRNLPDDVNILLIDHA
jgi:serine phosphatase RsbU (regulator of sigma subunit)